MSKRGKVFRECKTMMVEIKPIVDRLMLMKSNIDSLSDEDVDWLVKKIEASDEFKSLPEEFKEAFREEN